MYSTEGSVFNILSKLSPTQEACLSEKIASQGGLARAIIHPYFYDYFPPQGTETAKQVNSTFDRSKAGHERLLRSQDPHKPVSLIFEVSSHILQTVRLMDRAGIDLRGDHIYFVPTQYNSPTPDPVFIQYEKPNDRYNDNITWDNFSLILRRFLVNRVLVSGVMFAIEPRTKNKQYSPIDEYAQFKQDRKNQGAVDTNYNPYGCVSFALRQLAERGFSSELSGITSPQTRLNLATFEKRGPRIC